MREHGADREDRMITECHRSIRASRLCARALRSLLRDRRGNVTIEMAFLLTFLLILVMGAYDFGRLAIAQSGVTQAARAGAQFAVLDQANATDTAGMIQAARDEAEDPTLNVTARNFCRCPDSNAEVNCAVNCPDGEYAPLYVEVSVQDTLDMVFDYPGLPQARTYNLSSTSVMRVR